MARGGGEPVDFFVSYAQADEKWATWVAWVLEEEGHPVLIGAWDTLPGSNRVVDVHRAVHLADRTIAILSPEYLQEIAATPEWAAALAGDPDGRDRRLIPVMVTECRPGGLLAQLKHVSLVGLTDDAEARAVLVAAVRAGRAKPSRTPTFPGQQAGGAGPPRPTAAAGAAFPEGEDDADEGREATGEPAMAASTSSGPRPRADRRRPVLRVEDVDDPVVIGVHPTADPRGVMLAPDDPARRVPAYVRRDIADRLVYALGASGLVVVVGEAAAGTSRAAFEAMREKLPRYRFLHPRGPDDLADVAAAAARPGDCVIWLDDLEVFLGPAGLTVRLLTDLTAAPDGQVVLLATLRASTRARLDPRPRRAADGDVEVDVEDRFHRAGQQVLRLAHEIHLDRRWSAAELERARHTPDVRIAEALRHADHYGVAEYLAAGPGLLAEWRAAWTPGAHPRAAAIVAAAVDARRAGLPGGCGPALLRRLHGHYLNARGGPALRPEPFEEALAWASEPVRATSGLLVPAGRHGQRYQAFGYLVEAVEAAEVVVAAGPGHSSVPDEVWQVLLARSAPADCWHLGETALAHRELDRARAAFRRAADAGVAAAETRAADCVGEAGQRQQAVQALRDILDRRGRDLGPWHPDTFAVRNALAAWTGRAGDLRAAVVQFAELVADMSRELGDEHPDTLAARHAQANAIGRAGGLPDAVVAFRHLVRDRERVSGPRHPDTLAARHDLANWLGRTGDRAQALEEHDDVVRARTEVLGADHPDTLRSRHRAARLACEVVGLEQGLVRLAAIVRDRSHLLGADHPDTLRSRRQLARWTGHAGRYQEAAELFTRLTADCRRVLGPSHPDTLQAEVHQARWIADGGDPDRAVVLLDRLTGDHERALGTDHPYTLACRYRLAVATAQAGRSTAALAALEALAARELTLLGPDHPYTRRSRELLHRWQDGGPGPDGPSEPISGPEGQRAATWPIEPRGAPDVGGPDVGEPDVPGREPGVRGEPIWRFLDEEPGRELRRWSEQTGTVLHHAGWSDPGEAGSGAFVAAVYAWRGQMPVRKLVLKVIPRSRWTGQESREPHRHAEVLAAAPTDFRGRHLVELRWDPVPLPGGGWILFQEPAGGDIDAYRPLSHGLRDPDGLGAVTAVCRAVVSATLAEWNPVEPRPGFPTPGEYLRALVGSRLDAGAPLGRQLRERGLLTAAGRPARDTLGGDGDWPNPLGLVLDESLGRDHRVVRRTGNTHGDLHAGNILAPADPSAFRLIDLSRAGTDRPLAFDPAYLLLTNVARLLPRYPEARSPAFAQLLITPAGRHAWVPEPLRELVTAICEPADAWADGWNMRSEWREELLLCTVGCALVLSARDAVGEEGRHWFLLLAARGVDEYLKRYLGVATDPGPSLPSPSPSPSLPSLPSPSLPSPPSPSLPSPAGESGDDQGSAARSRPAGRDPDVGTVVISHCATDRGAAEQLGARLRAAGIVTWTSGKDILGGSHRQHAIFSTIEQSRFVVVLLSVAFGSRGEHNLEMHAAADAAQEFPDGARYVIPVRLEPCQVPWRLRDFQPIDLYESDGLERLVRALSLT